ncbi:MAG: anti-sigma factor [Balneolaceae bacterium]|nr:anti-sigma factor [Balneolaceae bacterium]
MKERLMARITSSRQSASGSGQAGAGAMNGGAGGPGTGSGEEKDSRMRLAVAASFVLLVVSLSLIFYAFYMSSQLSDTRQTVERQQVRIEQLTSELEQKEEMLAILGSREINVVFMSGMEVNPDGYGKVIWDPEREQALLQVSNLPAVPEDKDYQLWILRDNQAVSAGLFSMTD